MSSSSYPTSRVFVEEVVTDPVPPVVVPATPSPSVSVSTPPVLPQITPPPHILARQKLLEEYRANKGSLHNGLQAKVHATPITTESSGPELPSFLSQRTSSFVDPSLEKFPDTHVVAKPRKPIPTPDKGSDMMASVQSAMRSLAPLTLSTPALVTMAVLLMISSFVAGRFSGSPTTKSAAASEITATIKPLPTNEPTQVKPPQETIKQAKETMNQAVTLAKKSDATEEEKKQSSDAIVQAVDILTRAIAVYPDVGDLYFERAQIEKMVMQSATSMKAQAQVDYEKAISLSSLTAAYYRGFGEYYELLSDLPNAVAQYKQAVTLAPGDVDALFALSRMLSANNQLDEALKSYDLLLTKIPQSSSQYSMIAGERANVAEKIKGSTPQIASPSATLH